MGLNIYEPKGDKYNRLFGLESSSCTIDFEWFNWEKISDNEIALYGLVKEINSRVYKKDDKDYECKDELVKVSLHEKEYESYKKKLTPKCHESFFFWFLSNLEKGYYSGSLKFSTELDSVYNQIRKKELVGELETNRTLSIVANVQKISLETEPEKPSTQSYFGGGKSYIPKWKALVQSFPDYFRGMNIGSLEHVIDCCTDDFLYQKRRWRSKEFSREIAIKAIVVFGIATDNPLPVKDLIALNDKLKRKESEEKDEETETDEKTIAPGAATVSGKEGFDFAGEIAAIKAYCEALGMNKEDRVGLMRRLYGKTSLMMLADEELLDLSETLEAEINAA